MLDLLAAAIAATASCSLPPDLTPAPALAQEERRVLPVTKMVLAYYWWPNECRRDDARGTPGCAAGFGFKVHGLWPNGDHTTWPQFCRAPMPIAATTVRATYCVTPSTSLMQHEWAKHGTCHWPTAEAYFAQSRRLAAKLVAPDVGRLPPEGLTVGAIRDAFVAANPTLPRASLFVGTDDKQWLTEVRICMTRKYRPEACDDGQIGAPDRVPVRVWPR